MRILHTSDWHIGRTLYGRKRYAEFEAFLGWLAETIRQNEIDALLVAGDVFDNSTPSNRAQGLYYRFLCQLASSPCRHVVITAGNHDSPSFLNAPRELLKALDVHVIGSASETLADEVLLLKNEQNIPELIVCAVPYLRDRDIRTAEAGESVEDKERKMIAGIKNHYAAVTDLALQKSAKSGANLPIIAMGHLFAAGGRTVEDDGVRELYIGSLAHVPAGIFPRGLDYLALGHLHVPQKVNGSEAIRYSGSPLPMGFGEAEQHKSVCQVEFINRDLAIELIEIPVFQKLIRVSGNWEEISRRILELKEDDSDGWLEIVYAGDDVIGDLRERLEEATVNTKMEILRVKNSRIIERVLGQIHDQETLDELKADDVFKRCLDAHQVPEDQRRELFHTHEEALLSIYEDDTRAE